MTCTRVSLRAVHVRAGSYARVAAVVMLNQALVLAPCVYLAAHVWILRGMSVSASAEGLPSPIAALAQVGACALVMDIGAFRKVWCGVEQRVGAVATDFVNSSQGSTTVTARYTRRGCTSTSTSSTTRSQRRWLLRPSTRTL